ncbi:MULTISPECIES: SDR family NAD(P)-dependent oxidoreductase [Sinorhizobium]|uniref:SDR family NAD(P)-dependent oxidoreductase n=1 Tax=Sinorhizobium TaxID=28105 RepID=UPI00036D47E0|nr:MULTISPECIES: SDR family NAD(P)-dependent oxidoreductase [Sinorhizobium]PND21919.1 NAD(P)-dependent oxidoreductase [Ensifer sp. MMN_5]PND29401.1 NAD(P)-dependent oxidoreductase [Sinorhizobium sp. M4_45]
MSDGMKSVLVTGGASGIGLEIARLLNDRGWRVYLVDRNADALADACRAIPIDPAQAIACSVTDEKEVASAIETAAARAPLRAVINSAGIAIDRPAVETSVDDFRRILDVNLTGTFIVCREAARHWLTTATPGAIVNISSVSGLVGNKGRAAYGASKGAVNLLTYILATELGQDGIRVNAIAPGAIDTPLSRAVHTDDVRAQWHERIPQRRYGSSGEIAASAAFLISEEASYINGQVLAVDGGFVNAGLALKGR